jgi:hypothetical protein
VAREGDAQNVQEDPLQEVGVIIVRLWWEQAKSDDVAMRARVTSTINGVAGTSCAAATIDGICASVRAAVDRFTASRPADTRDMRG